MNSITRRRALQLFGAAGMVGGVVGCGGSLDDSGGGGGGGGSEGPVKIGLLIPQSGTYAPLGVDMQRGWELYLDQHDGRLGGREIETVTADEGEGPDTGVPAAQRLLQAEQVDIIVGVVNSAIALGIVDMVTEANKLMVITNAGANDITGSARTPNIWRTSFTNGQIAAAMGRHLATTEYANSVYALAPDYAAGQEVLEAFTAALEEGGGRVVGQALPPFGTTQDYQPFLSGVRQSGAQATFCFFSGGEAVSFVQQYAQFGLKDTTPLFGSGFLTEGSVLEAQGDAALGVQGTLHYSTELDNPANVEFLEAYRAASDNADPTVFSVATYDAGLVLDQALQSTEGLSGEQMAAALGDIGEISDSPRGAWTFDGQSPRQTIYLRTVERQDGRLVNAVTQELGTVSQTS